MISAIFINGTTFTLDDDQTTVFEIGRRVRADCGVDGFKYGTIESSSFDGTNTTTVQLTSASDDLTSNLDTVKFGIIGVGSDNSMPIHEHTSDEGTGGTITEESISDLDKYTQSEIDAFNAVYDNNFSNIVQSDSDAGERTGFVNRTDSVLSFNDNTEELTIAGTYSYYIHGIRYDITESKSLAIIGVGINYFYLDTDEDLNVTQTWNTLTILRNNAYVAAVYWDGNQHIYIGDERHSINWDWNIHAYHHSTEGTWWRDGLGLVDVNAAQSALIFYNGGDDTLWNMTIVASFINDFVESTDQNNTDGGTQSLSFVDSEDDDICQIANPEGYITLTPYTNFGGWVYLTNFSAGHEILFYGWNTGTGTIVGNTVNLTDYIVEANEDVWQKFEIPLADMGLTGETLDAIRFQIVDAGIGTPEGYFDDFVFNGSGGDADDDLTFGVGSGNIIDEDLTHFIDAVANGEEEFKVIYLTGEDTTWTIDSTSKVVFKSYDGGSGRLAYNLLDGTSWTQAEVPNGGFVLGFLFATNDEEKQLFGVQAQSYYTTLDDAREAVTTDILSIITGNIPFEEFTPIAAVIAETHNNYVNTWKAKIVYIDEYNSVSWQDFRGFQGSSTGGLNISNHGNLDGLGGDDHPQYSKADGSRAFTGTVVGVTPVLDQHLATKGYVDGEIETGVVHNQTLGLQGGDSTAEFYHLTEEVYNGLNSNGLNIECSYYYVKQFETINDGCQINRGILDVGTPASFKGDLRLYGEASAGGLITAYVNNADDDTIDYYRINVNEDDLLIGPDIDLDSLKYNAAVTQWQFTGSEGVKIIEKLVIPLDEPTSLEDGCIWLTA